MELFPAIPGEVQTCPDAPQEQSYPPPAAPSAGSGRPPFLAGLNGRAVGRGFPVLILSGAAALGCLALFCFDPVRYHFYPVCLFHQTTGLLCPGCGSLRALHQLLHGHLQRAFAFNPLLIASLPPALALGLVWAIRRSRNQPMFTQPRTAWLWLVVFLLIGFAFTVWRNLPGAASVLGG